MLRKVEIQLLRSKINFLNAQIASFHDSGLFPSAEIAALSAPLLPQIQEMQEQILKLQASENENAGDVALTPKKQTV